MILCPHAVCHQGYQGSGTYAQRSGTLSFQAMLLPGFTTAVFQTGHCSTCCEAGGLVRNVKGQVFLEFTDMTYSGKSKGKQHYFKMIFAQTPKTQKVLLFDQNHGLTPLQKCKFFDFLKMTFLQFRKVGFVSKTLFRSIPRCFLYKNRHA